MNKYIQAICEYIKTKTKAKYAYEDPQTGEIYYYKRRGLYRKNGRPLVPVMGKDTSKE